MATDPVVKAAQDQEAEAKRKAEHQVQDLRKLNANVDPDAEAESAETNKDPALKAQESGASTTESPFASLSPAVQAALEKAGITSVEQAKALGAEGLEKLDGVGEVSAGKILAL